VRILGTPTILTVVYVGPDGALPAKTLRDAEWESLMNPDSDGEPEDSDDRVIDFEEAKRRHWFTSRSYENRRRKRITRSQGNLWEQSEDAIPPTQHVQQRLIPITPIHPTLPSTSDPQGGLSNWRRLWQSCYKPSSLLLAVSWLWQLNQPSKIADWLGISHVGRRHVPRMLWTFPLRLDGKSRLQERILASHRR
jgi:hypothetical protein